MKWFYVIALAGWGISRLASAGEGGAAPQDMAERTKACVACHGDQGRAGPDGYYPRLAGKPAGYLYHQMQNFSQGKRRYVMMRRMMEPLSPSYQQEIAAYFASLQVPYVAPASAKVPLSATQMARGKTLALEGDTALRLPACNSCHGEALMGQGANVPGLLGLPAAYLGAQLSAWRSGDRQTPAPDCMAEIAKRLPADDANAVVAWLATQAVPAAHGRAPSAVRTPRVAHDLRCASAPDLQGGTP